VQGVARHVAAAHRSRACEGKRDCIDVCPHDVFEVRRIDAADHQALSWLARAKVFVHRRQTA
jgi:4Fe-4S ferredoxin